MAEELPNFIEFRHLVDETDALDGMVAPGRLTRISSPFSIAQPLHVTLRFHYDSDSRIRVHGQLSTRVGAVCQRCLGDMEIDVARTIDVVVADSHGDVNDADEEDPPDIVVVEDGRFQLGAFAEDELILACPMIPAHEPDDCPVRIEAGPGEGGDRKRPFADLGDMLAQATDKTNGPKG